MSAASDKVLAKKREIEARLAEVREEFKAIGSGFLVEHFAPLFAEHSEVKGFQWTQYTPYFNDGDACEFSSHHAYGEILVLEDPDEPDADPVTMEDLGIEYKSDEWKRLCDISDKFRAAFPDLSDDDMESLFGDHVRVTIYPDGVEVEEYNHD